MNANRLPAILFMFFSAAALPARSQVWQWSVPVGQVLSEETKAAPTAFLWVPEHCKKVKGVVFTQHNMVEEGIPEDPPVDPFCHTATRKISHKITFVAWQYGGNTAAQLQSAEPVERTFFITKK